MSVEAIKKAVPDAALPAAEPVAWLVKRYDLDGILLDTELSFVRPTIRSTCRTDMEPLYADPPVPSVAVKALDARSLAIDIVDGVKGYTLEFAQDQQAHMIDWDIAERKINDSLSAQVQDVAGWQPPQDCDGKEQLAFEAWAGSNRYDMHEHPLHYLFMDAKTNAARQGWKAALQYVRDQFPAAPAKQEASHVTSK